jgi:pyridoxine 4-dehydrogenase
MSANAYTTLGGTASHIKIGKIAYGLMMMTAVPTPTPDEQAFEAIKTAIEQVPEGSKLFLNSGWYICTNVFRHATYHFHEPGEFYGRNPPEANLQLVARFFTKYPELADRTFLSVKVSILPF